MDRTWSSDSAERRATGVGPTIAYASALVLAVFGLLFLGEATSVLGGSLPLV